MVWKDAVVFVEVSEKWPLNVDCACVQMLTVVHVGSNQCLDRSLPSERDTPTIGL